MKKSELRTIIKEEIKSALLEYEIEDIKDTTLSPLIKQKIAQFVKTIEGNKSLTRVKIAAILNEIISALGLDRRQITMYMNMVKQQQLQDTQKAKMAEKGYVDAGKTAKKK